MPPLTDRKRPQTLRQAKKAYQKSGSRLSASELRQIERAAELQERAARMREREHKRKDNLKKKAEKLEKESGMRRRMGITSPVKGDYVGPSQLRLGDYLGAGLKRKREDEGYKAKEAMNTSIPDRFGLEPMGPPVLQVKPKSRSPLQVRSTNQSVPRIYQRPQSQQKSTFAVEDDWADFLVSNTQIERELSTPEMESVPQPPAAPPCPVCPKIFPIEDTADLLQFLSTQDLDEIDEAPPVPQLKDPTVRPIEGPTDLLEQLSTRALDDTGEAPPITESKTLTTLLVEEDPVDLLALFSSQELDDVGDVPPVARTLLKEEEFGDDLTDKELGDLAEDFELHTGARTELDGSSSSYTLRGGGPAGSQQYIAATTFDYGDFDISTQDLRDLAPSNDALSIHRAVSSPQDL